MEDLTKKIIIIVLLVLGIGYMCYSQYRIETEHIDEVMAINYYDEEDVKELASLLEEYSQTEYSDEEARKTALFYTLNTFYDTHFAGCTTSKVGLYIKDLNDRSFLDETGVDLNNDLYLNGYHIKAGDYYELARVLMILDNEEGNEHTIGEELDQINDDTILVIKIIFAITYTFVTLKFIFFTEFSKKNYLKNIIIYCLILIGIFAINIIVLKLSDYIINFLGHYKNYGFYGYGNANSLLNLGLFSAIDLLKVFVITIILNAIINFKNIKTCFEKKSKNKN